MDQPRRRQRRQGHQVVGPFFLMHPAPLITIVDKGETVRDARHRQLESPGNAFVLAVLEHAHHQRRRRQARQVGDEQQGGAGAPAAAEQPRMADHRAPGGPVGHLAEQGKGLTSRGAGSGHLVNDVTLEHAILAAAEKKGEPPAGARRGPGGAGVKSNGPGLPWPLSPATVAARRRVRGWRFAVIFANQ